MINIEVQGIREVADKLKKLMDAVTKDMEKTLSDSAEGIIYPKIQERFDTEGFGRWQPHTEKTHFFRQNRLGYYGMFKFAGEDKILQWSGRLKGSVTGGAESTKTITQTSEGTSMILGTNVPHATLLHEGGQTDWGEPMEGRLIYEPEDFKTELIDYIREQIKVVINS
mgnify:CR=1 FL=1